MLPLTPQTPGVFEVNTTGRLELALATRAVGVVPKVWLPGEAKVIVCEAAPTLKVLDTTGAAAKLVLPGWLASTVQLPVLASNSVVPETVQTAGVLDTRDTARPEVALATRAGGVLPRVWLPGELKLMVCVMGATVKVLLTSAAAAKLALPA